jgi:YggT family protein
MDLEAVALAITLVARLLAWIVIANVLLSYFVSPYHPVREALDRITEPLLAPIRRVMPQTGVIDISPMVLILLIELLRFIIVQAIAQ